METGKGSDGASLLGSEPVSPRGRLFLQREVEHVIHCIITFQNPIDVPALTSSLSSSFVRCPRMRSLVVKDRHGREHWKELPELDVEDHIIIVPEGEEERENWENDIFVNDYVASLVSWGTMRRDIPLWDVHILPRNRRSIVMRLHHALGDCLSLTALLLASFNQGNSPMGVVGDEKESEPRERFSTVEGVWRTMKAVWYSIPHVPGFPLFAARLKEDKTMIADGVRVQVLPRKLASLALCLDDMKAVKNKLNAKINDVFIGITAYGIAKYYGLKSNDTSKHASMTALNMVNVRGQGLKDLVKSLEKGETLKWGNELGYFMLGVDLNEETGDPLNYVRKVKATLDKKKISLEAEYTYTGTGLIMSFLGPKAAVLVSSNVLSNVSLLFSNINGPPYPITLGNNLITKVGFTASGLPVPIDVRIFSYNGKASLQVLVAAQLIPDPELLCKCIEEALHEMKAKATNS